MKKVLVIHQNFPGQFKSIARDLARDPGVVLVTIGKKGCPQLAGVRTLTYSLHRAPAAATHHYARSFEAGILHGQAVLRVLQKLKREGFVPDVVLAHPGWGESLFVKDVFPHARLVHFCEYYYHAHGADAGFDPEFPLTLDDAARIRARNALQLMNLEHCDVAVTPTEWQKSLHPKAYQDKISVIHEGIDTETMRPDPDASFTLPNGKVLRYGDQVVTYVARNLEPYRGFHIFMRALPQILEQNPGCDIVIVGGDGVSYGSKPVDAPDWRTKMQGEVGLDAGRVHFLGKIPFARYHSLLQVSKAHVYLTYPFVLSWSALEAMACGCAVIGSDTTPVREVIRNDDNGLLVDFFDVQALAGKVGDILTDKADYVGLRQRAAVSVRDAYSVHAGLSKYRSLLGLSAAKPKVGGGAPIHPS